MRILLVGINYAPELTGIGKYSSEMAEWLAGAGHEVRVVTAPPYYPEWRVAEGYTAWSYRAETMRGVSVWRCPVWVPARPSGLTRLLHLASFALSSLPVLLRQVFWGADAVIVIEPPLICAPPSWLVSRLCRARSWLHIQDFEVDAAFDLGILPAGFLRKIVLFIERILMRSFDRVSTISPNMLARLINKGVPQRNAVMFPNWVDTQAIVPIDGSSPMRAELGISADSIVALYSGNMGEKQGLEIVLDAAQKLAEDQNILFILCGDGAARNRLQEKYVHLKNVLWLPLQPLEKLNDLLNTADIHLLPQRADAADLVMPSKLTGMLASGRSVIATARSGTQLAEIVSNCGIVIEPEDADAFAHALKRLAGNREARLALGKAGRVFAEEHMGKNAVLNAFEKQLELLVQKQPISPVMR